LGDTVLETAFPKINDAKKDPSMRLLLKSASIVDFVFVCS